MSDKSRALVAVGQRGVVASVTRQMTITEKLISRIQAVQALSGQNNSVLQTEQMSATEWYKKPDIDTNSNLVNSPPLKPQQ